MTDVPRPPPPPRVVVVEDEQPVDPAGATLTPAGKPALMPISLVLRQQREILDKFAGIADERRRLREAIEDLQHGQKIAGRRDRNLDVVVRALKSEITAILWAMPGIQRGLDGVRILVVDDEPGLRRIAPRALSQTGATVYTAATCAEARYVCAHNEVHAVISDVLLTDGSGVELVRELRAENPTLLILMMTGADEAEVAEEVADVGVERVFGKPFELTQLVELLLARFVTRGERPTEPPGPGDG